MEMFFRFVLLVISLIFMFFLFDVLIPKIKRAYKLHKELQEKEISRKKFKEQMKELEIK